MQALKRKTCIEHSLCSKFKEQKQENSKKDIQISHLVNENTQLRHCNRLSKINKLKKSNSYLRSCNTKNKYKCIETKSQLKKENNALKRKICELEEANKVLTANCDELLRENECINTKCNEKTYSTACRKAIYHCLLNQVPVTSVCNVIEAVILELCDKAIDVMPDCKFVDMS